MHKLDSTWEIIRIPEKSEFSEEDKQQMKALAGKCSEVEDISFVHDYDDDMKVVVEYYNGGSTVASNGYMAYCENLDILLFLTYEQYVKLFKGVTL
jgi:hypothetical protein